MCFISTMYDFVQKSDSYASEVREIEIRFRVKQGTPFLHIPVFFLSVHKSILHRPSVDARREVRTTEWCISSGSKSFKRPLEERARSQVPSVFLLT